MRAHPRSAFVRSRGRPAKAGFAVARALAIWAMALALAGCGFKLRQAPHFVFSTIYIGAAPNSSFEIETFTSRLVRSER